MDKQMKTIFKNLTFNITCFQVSVFGVTHLLYRPIGICQEKKGHLCTPEDWNYMNTLSLSACWWEGWMISPAGPIKHTNSWDVLNYKWKAKIVPTHKALTIKTKHLLTSQVFSASISVIETRVLNSCGCWEAWSQKNYIFSSCVH